ncbi:hypothetical protein XENOCAPTIV_002263 [Xenoophorus captivus]|uniref:Uncharacterized protein n=1 Tax=Xenoophorus captivus TaxID=1517983 RepID=A0ABV0SCV8_9TELE
MVGCLEMHKGTLLCQFPQYIRQHTKREWKRLIVKRTQSFSIVKGLVVDMHQNCLQHMEKNCKRCKGQNHFAKQCFSKMQQNKYKSVHAMDETALSDTFFASVVTQEDSKPRKRKQSMNRDEQDRWMVPLQVNRALIPFKLDTGANANLKK